MKIKEYYRKILLLTIAIVAGLFYSCNISNTSDDAGSKGFEIKRGVNLSHWLSQDFGWVPKYTLISENDIRFIDSIGYDHVRIPIDEQELWDDNGEPVEEGFNSLLNCLDWCGKYNLRAIVDLHIIRTHHFNAANEGGFNTLWVDTTAQNSFINIWVQLSETLHKYPENMVAYELLNEVVAPEHDDWNKLLNRAIAEIREKEPDRVLVVGPNMWQIAPNLQYLKLPENDSNIILSFHTYNPLAFTHYKANWTPAGDFPGKVTYPGQIISDEDYNKYIDTTNAEMVNAFADARDYFNKQRIVEGFEMGIQYAKSKNLQLYCGEFGCLPTVDRDERLKYYSDIVSAFEENNIAWCNWEYKGDFGIYHFDTLKKVSLSPDYELIDILLHNK
jgi:endoglucanase